MFQTFSTVFCGVQKPGLENTPPGWKFLFLPNGDPFLKLSAQGTLCSAGSTALATPPGSLLCLHKDNAVFISTPLNSTHIAKTEWEEQEGGRKK